MKVSSNKHEILMNDSESSIEDDLLEDDQDVEESDQDSV